MNQRLLINSRQRLKSLLILFAACISLVTANGQTITTVAGNGTSAYAGNGGLATSASLQDGNIKTVVDGAGNKYILSYNHSNIRKINSSGIISAYAGIPSSAGFSGDGGPANSAQFNFPTGIAVDGSGNVYVADRSNHRIRRIDAATNIITTIAGTGSGSYFGDGGPATSAGVPSPYAVACDASGYLYIIQQGDQGRIRRVDLSTGIITTVAGNGVSGFAGDGGPATSAQINAWGGIATDASGNIYFSDGGTRIRKITVSTGIISTVAGNGTGGSSGDGGSAIAAAFYGMAVEVDPVGNIFIFDFNSNTVRRVDIATSIIDVFAGNGSSGFSGDGGPALAASIAFYEQLSAAPNGDIYLSGWGDSRVRMVTNTVVTPLVVSGTSTNETPCNTSNNGTATVTTITNGTGPYTYSWAPSGGTAATATGLSAGTYTVTVTDATLNTGTATFTITEPTAITGTASQTNVSCNGGNNGSASVIASGGGSPFYSYSWAPVGGTGTTASNLAAGNYTVTITNPFGCTGTQTYTITQPTALSIAPTQTNVLCNGGATGTATATVSGGAGFYSYAWSPNGGTGSTATGLTAGVYTVYVTDFNFCTASQTYNITQPTAITSTGTQTNVGCFGGSTGSATVTPSGGTTPYTYSWAPNGGTAATATGLSAGNYTVTITDANNCTATRTYNITGPTAALSATGTQTNVSCNGGANGTATVTASGGTSPYSYSWAPSGGTAATATGLAAGTYTVTVTDLNLCTTTVTYTITQPTAITTTGTQTNVSCNGGANGSASVTASGGTGAYTYSWAPSGGTASTATGLAAGNYTVTITDANSCTATRTYAITQPTALATTGSSTNVLCNGGSTGTASVSVTGGTPSYTYSWAPTGGTAATATGLSAGNYTVTVTDANSCTITHTYTITQPAALATTGSQVNLLCNGASTGSATVVASGGTTPYSYSWAPSGGTGSTATGLTAGNYTVTVTDANLCTTTHTYTLTQPTAITSTGTQTNINCNGGSNGSATVTASGGTGSYTYSWAPFGGTGSTASNLTAGVYTVTVTDANSCTHTHTFNITQPAALTATGTQSNVLCNGGNTGSATVTVTGGTTPYSYFWVPTGGTASTASNLTVGSYTVAILDANSCATSYSFNITQPAALASTTTQSNVTCNAGADGVASIAVTGGTTPYSYSWAPSGGTAATATGLTSGNYTVTVTDANACTHQRTFNITQPTAITATASQTNVSCFGGSNGTASVVASGGSSPFYSYSWAPSGGTGTTATGLSAGNYTCTITNSLGCTGTATFTITQPAAALATTGSQSNILCNGAFTGSASVMASGGTTPYSYNWAPTGGVAATATGLAAGNYTVTVTDANGCVTTRTYNLTQPTAITSTGSQTNVACNGNSTGSATVTASGGVGPYTYSWAPTGGTAATATGLAAGTYTVTITDANSCTATRSYTITQPTALATTGTQTNVLCNGGNSGTATVSVTGGTGAYTYSWAPSGGTAATATGLAVGNYTVTVTDANSCTTTRTYAITQPAAITTVSSQTNVSCNGGSNGTATVTATGGTGAYTYSWAPSGGTAATATGLAAGNYTVTVTDANLCTATRTYNITQPAVLATTGTQTNVTCNGFNNGTATVSPSGGTTPYSYSWAPGGGTSATISNLAPNVYTVTVTDANGCTATRTYNITQPAVLTTSGSSTNVACFGASTGTATVVPSGGTTPYTYVWAPTGGTAATTTNRPAGTYTVTVTDANGCTATHTYNITQPTQLTATTTQVNVSCNSGSNGSATVVVSGGVTPYTYVWTPYGGTAATASNLNSNVYTVTVTDANSCTLVRTFNITQPTYLSTTGSQVNVSCNGAGDASATVLPSGGTPGYTYSWAPTGGTGATASNLTPGVYTVTVTDANLCVATRTYNITQPAVLATTAAQSNVLCNGGTGSASIAATGGTMPYSYDWQPGGYNTAAVSGLMAGTYTATVTDANGCTSSQAYTITEPTALTYTTSQSDALCNGGNTGSATITLSGGTAPYTYNWIPTGGTAATETGLTAGSYTVVATDDNGCSVTASYTIAEPTALAVAATSNSPVCTGEQLDLTGSVAGGTMPYTVSWSGPNSYTSSLSTPSIGNVTLSEAGSYTFSVTDDNGCTASDITTVAINETPMVTTQPVPTTACYGASAGFSVTATGTGISYQWRADGVNLSDVGVYSGSNTNTLTISDATGLDGTMYDVIVSGVCTPDTSIAVMLTAPSFNTWTGTIDTAWSNPGNWQCGNIPTINTDVIIPFSAPRMPLVDIPGAQANSVTINSGASLAFVGTGSQLEILADITNLGTFNASNGAVMLSGSGTQSIPGGTYAEIELAGSNTKSAQGNLTVTGNLILTGGYLQLGNTNLTLTSTAGVTGGDASSHVVTNGIGVLIAQGLGVGGIMVPVTFPVGTTPGIYTPATLFNGGTVDNFSVRVIENVYSDYNNELPVGSPLYANSVKKTWFINEAVDGGSDAIVSLSWPLTEELPNFNNSLCDVSHYIEDSSNWNSGPVGQATGTTTLFTHSRPNVTSFSPFGLGTQSSPLGISAVTLAGVYNIGTKAVDLSWNKSNDKDVASYGVERSVDGATFSAIGSRDAGEDSYTLTDAEAGKLGVRNIFYRVRVISNDGYVYSNTVKVDLESMLVTYGMTLYPNPVTGGEMFISLTNNSLATDMDIAIVDMLGKEVKKYHYNAGTYNAGAIPVNVAELAQGVYTVKVKQAGTTMQTAKFTKK